jgi:hypothetical protein
VSEEALEGTAAAAAARWRPAARRSTRATCGCVAAAVLVSALLRLRMMFTPLNADEGGYLAIARAWAHGRVLYRDVWIDRPQGLIVVFRVWDWISDGDNGSVRLMAMLFGALLVVSSAVVAWALYGQIAARWTALICAVVSAAPILEGYIANGELLSSAVATTGLAVSVIGVRKAHAARWMFGAGLLAGAALSLKQSGFDGLVAMWVWLTVESVAEPAQRCRAARAAAALSAGTAVVVVAMLTHGALTGWERWWFAVGGYRAATLSLFNHPSWYTLHRTVRYGAVVLGPALLIGVVALISGRGRRTGVPPRWRRRDLLVVTWLVAASCAFLLGGGYWRHYWLLLAAPISTLAGAALGRARRRAGVAFALVVAPALVVSIWVFMGDARTVTARAASDHQAVVDHDVATWFGRHRRRGDTLYVLCGGPAVYADTGEDPPVPYLWFPEVVVGPHATQQLISYLDRSAPAYIARYVSANRCDPSGRVHSIINERYRDDTTVDGVTILARR